MIETKVQIAADLLPLIRHLWQGGVLAIGPYNNEVHMRTDLFRATFPDVKTPVAKHDENNWLYQTMVNIDGVSVRFFCLNEKEAFE